ncbi:HPP family protein [Desulfovibrio sp. OttesenSCG-928-C06]|nr:HPP family protein [Desulfovibrio sp. OttesenSCG-928-C06]
MKTLLVKMRGVSKAPPVAQRDEILLAFVGSSLALGLVAMLHGLCLENTGLPLIMAPFGASAVLLFGAFKSPLAQPRNVIGGHIISALVGVSIYQIVGDYPMLAASLAVPTAIVLMHASNTLHPPGGATAFVTSAGGAAVHSLGYWYVLTPSAAGSAIMVLVALVVNNLHRRHRYPQFW